MRAVRHSPLSGARFQVPATRPGKMWSALNHLSVGEVQLTLVWLPASSRFGRYQHPFVRSVSGSMPLQTLSMYMSSVMTLTWFSSGCLPFASSISIKNDRRREPLSAIHSLPSMCSRTNAGREPCTYGLSFCSYSCMGDAGRRPHHTVHATHAERFGTRIRIRIWSCLRGWRVCLPSFDEQVHSSLVGVGWGFGKRRS